MTDVFIIRRKDTETHIEEGHVKTEAETGVLLPQTEHLGLPGVGEARKDSSLEPSEGAWPS